MFPTTNFDPIFMPGMPGAPTHPAAYGLHFGLAGQRADADKSTETRSYAATFFSPSPTSRKSDSNTQDLRVKYAQASSDIASRDGALAALQADLARGFGSTASTASRIDALDKECEAQLEELGIQLETINNLTAELNGLRDPQDKLKAYDELKGHNAKLQADLDASEDRAEWYKGECKRWEGETRHWQRAATSEQRNAEQLRSRTSGANRDSLELARTQSSLKEAWSSIADLERQLKRAREKEATMAEELGRRGKAIAEMKAHQSERKAKWRAMHARAQVAESAGQRQAATIAALEAEVRDARAALWNKGMGIVKVEGVDGAATYREGSASTSGGAEPAKASTSPDLYSRLGLLLDEESRMDTE